MFSLEGYNYCDFKQRYLVISFAKIARSVKEVLSMKTTFDENKAKETKHGIQNPW